MIGFSCHLLLLAHIGDLIGPVIGLLAFIGWVIKAVVEANKQAPPGRPRAPVVPPPGQAAGRAAGPQPAGGQADPLRAQVEEFLRRAGRVPQANQPIATARPTIAAKEGGIELLIDDETSLGSPPLNPESQRPTDRRSPQVPPPAVPRTLVPRTVKQPPARRLALERRPESMGESVAERSRALGQRTAQLGQRIITEDQQFDVQVKSKFDHTVGTLAEAAVTAKQTAPSETPAARIAAMLANPEGVRQAIVVNEILHRPSDRW